MLVGGAEKHAVSLVNHLDATRFRIGLCDVKPEGNLAREVDSRAARRELLAQRRAASST